MTRTETMRDALDSAAAFMQSWKCPTCAFPVDHECQYPDYATEVLFRFDELLNAEKLVGEIDAWTNYAYSPNDEHVERRIQFGSNGVRNEASRLFIKLRATLSDEPDSVVTAEANA